MGRWKRATLAISREACDVDVGLQSVKNTVPESSTGSFPVCPGPLPDKGTKLHIQS